MILRIGGGPERPLVQHYVHNNSRRASWDEFFDRILSILVPNETPLEDLADQRRVTFAALFGKLFFIDFCDLLRGPGRRGGSC